LAAAADSQRRGRDLTDIRFTLDAFPEHSRREWRVLRLSKHALSFAEGGERALGRPLLEGRYNQKVWK
jgi:hypothetical protein